MSKFPRKLVSNTEPPASTAGMYTTIERLQSFTAATGGMAITAVAITDNTYTALDDTAVSTSGGYIKLTGTGFASGAVAYINSIAATTTFTSSTELRVVVPANVVGTYSLTAFNTTGSGAIWAAGLVYSGFPTVTTSSYTNSSAVVSTQLVATGDGTLVYSLQGGSTLPSGVNLSSSGLLSGTVTGITVSTVYTFTVLVNDAQLQTTQQLITLSVVLGDQYFNSTVLLLHGDGPAIPATIEILVVAGGGGGRDVSGAIAGIRDSAGGGAGGVIYNAALAVTSGAVYPLTIGTGGASATAGISSVWNTSFTASGGGAGGQVYIAGGAGGSGGGGANYQSAAGASNQSAYSGWTVYGNAGGAGIDTGPAWGAGGGGGAGAAGAAGTSTTGGAGGVGISNSITGVATYYAGGGGGGAANGAIAAGGTGGGGVSTNSAIGGAATPNTGGGGGGVGNTTGVSYAGGAGGSGVSVIAYPSAYADLVVSSGLTYTMSTVTRSGYKVYTFTAGTGTITIPSNNNNTFKDSSTNNFTITRTGTPTQGTFSPFSQTGWSGYFNGTTDALNAVGTTQFQLSTLDFTVESWIYLTTSPAAATHIVGTYDGGNGGWALYVSIAAAGLAFRNGDNAGIRTVTTAIPLNSWCHVAAVRQSGVLNFYLNGTAIGAGQAFTEDITRNNTYGCNIGRYLTSISQAGGYFPGYLSNVRVVKGTAVYTSNFTPSTTPLTAISGTSLLTLQSNYFKDNGSNNFAITITGTPSIQAFSPFGSGGAYSTSSVGASMYFNGTPDYVTASGANAQLTTGQFTIEGWVYRKATGTGQNIINNFLWLTGQNAGWLVSVTSTNGIGLSVSTGTFNSVTSIVSSPAATVQASAWSHFAITRDASNLIRIFVNGTLLASTTYATTLNLNSGTTLTGTRIGTAIWDNIGQSYFAGYISNVRIINNNAIYTANFTPPAAPLTAVSGTTFLLNGTNAAIYDQTAKNDLITVGSAVVSATQSKFGGRAMFFNGTTDYLTTVDKPTLQLETGDFTIEAWVYLTTASTSRGLVSKGPVAGTTGWECKFNSANVFRFEWTASSLVGTTTIPITTWTHVAVVRSGVAVGNVKLYVNGTLYATSAVAVTDNFTQTDPLRIGIDRVGTGFFPGYVDDLRITKYARYTANFTPPTTTFLDQ